MEKLDTRIDKWLWSVRLFKTRSMATDVCNAGKVKLNGTNVKPSRSVCTEEIYEVHIGSLNKTVKVIGSPKSRVGAPLVPQYMEDLTPQEEYDRMKTLHTYEFRPHGLGRPTKRDRRQLEYIKEQFATEEDYED
ncbi:MAG: RNA-binding S4 domain-containing protein [Bacteroidales bacterium]|nr:RNA-binding S4 domain-containing protein [Bacteroidales bacterium]